MFVTIINDCRDANAIARQETRVASLIKSPTTFVGVHTDIEAAGNLIDTLDAAGDEPGIVLVNVAPRNHDAKKWENGTPFVHFTYKNVLVVSTVDGNTLSLVKKLGLVETVHLMDIPVVLSSLREAAHIDETLAKQISETQFRSFEFVPRVAHWLRQGFNIQSTPFSLEEVPDLHDTVWWIDNFGNAKTSLLPEDCNFTPGTPATLTIGSLNTYNRLKDVPNDEAAFIVGSSGIDNKRFLEIVMQGQSAIEHFELTVGMKLLP